MDGNIAMLAESLQDSHPNFLYPKLPDHESNPKDPMDPSDTVAAYKTELERQRVINFKNDLNYLNQQIAHYGKLYKKWKKVDGALRYFTMTVTGVSSIGGVLVLSIATCGIETALVIPVSIALGSLTLVFPWSIRETSSLIWGPSANCGRHLISSSYPLIDRWSGHLWSPS